MAVLRSIAAMMATLAGCYAPELRDCVVACASEGDCGPGQVCGSDGRCAAPEVAGRCASAAPLSDAGIDDVTVTDAPADAAIDAPPDAPPLAQLIVQIAGKGFVTVAGIGTCNYSAPMHTCSYAVMPGTQLDLTATGIGGDEFEKWQSAACAGQDETCVTTAALPSTTVAAKFKH
jgi:hypothetical protein